MAISRITNPTNKTWRNPRFDGWSDETQTWSDQTQGITHEIGSSPYVKGIGPMADNYPAGCRLVIPRELPPSDTNIVSPSYPRLNIWHKCRLEDAKFKPDQKISTDGNPLDTVRQIRREIWGRDDITPIEKLDLYFDRVDCLNYEELRLYIFKYKSMTYDNLVLRELIYRQPENSGFKARLASIDNGLLDLKKTSLQILRSWFESPALTQDNYASLFKAASKYMSGVGGDFPAFPSLYTFKFYLVDFGIGATTYLSMYGDFAGSGL